MHLDTNVAQKGVICVWPKKWLLFQLTQKFYWTKELDWYQNIATGTSLFWIVSNKSHFSWHGNCLKVWQSDKLTGDGEFFGSKHIWFKNQEKLDLFLSKNISKFFPFPSPSETCALTFNFEFERNPKNFFYY